MKPTLNPEQQRAVEYLDGPLLVLAGPGTGKTQLLSSKVAYILEHTDANPENILCLTFTEAGAQNMRDRLQTIIGKAASDVNIYTYHAFGKTILDRYQNYAEIPERHLETPVDETLQHQIIIRLQKSLSALDILRTADPKDILDTISSAKSARLSADDLKAIVSANQADGEQIVAAVSPLLESAPKGLRVNKAIPELYEPILEALVPLISPEPIVGNIERLANTMVRELRQAIEKTEAAAKPDTKLLGAWRKKYFEPDSDGHYRLTDYIANKKLSSLANLMAKYETYLEEHGLFDFDDMIEWAIRYLKTDRGFQLSLSELFQYILLDEFQDTNTSQFELIKLLTDYEKPVIMAVGDDDQAIYAFQGANASNLMDFREHYNAEVITLTTNYRSTDEILKLSRQIADQITDSFAKSYPDITKVLTSHHDLTKGAPDSPQISRHEFPCAEAEYNWVATRIRQLVDSGVNARDIAVLAPKHKYLVAILPYLKAQNLDITYEKRENLLENPEIHALITLSEFIEALAAGKQPSHLLMEILSYDFWSHNPAEVMSLFSDRFTKKPTLEYLNTSTFQPLANFFAALATKSLTTPLELWLNYLIGTTELDGYTSPFLSYCQAHFRPSELLEFYESLATFRQVVFSHMNGISQDSKKSAPKLSDFVAAISDYQEAGSEIMRISNYRDNSDAVQVMTAFKSKGLEFPHVFLTAVDDTCWGRGKGNNNKLALPKNLLPIRHTGATDDERLRTLFVALTRAKSTLTLTSARANPDGKPLARLCYLNESSPEEDDQISPYLPDAAQKIYLHQNELSPEQKISTLTLSWTAPYQTFTPEIEALETERVAGYRLSASDLTSFINLTYAGPQSIYQRLILRAPEPPNTPEQLYGTLIHKIFEEVTNHQLDDAAALELFRDLAQKTELEPDDQARLSEFGLHNLEIALREFGPILRHIHAKGEINLSSEHPVYHGVPLVGKIDHIELDPEQKTIEIFDYKTGKYRPESWNSHPTAYLYRLQLGFYKLLLNLSPSFAKYRVTRGHILYVTPDDDSKVHDKVYDYNEKEEQELGQLIEAVYREITSLDFIKNSDIFLPSDKSANMSRIREFVAKITEQ